MGNATESTLPHGNTSAMTAKPAGHAPVPPVMSRSLRQMQFLSESVTEIRQV